MKNFLAFLGAGALIMASACSATTGGDGDAVDGIGSDAGGGSDSGGSDAGGTDTGAADTGGGGATGWKSVVIYDKYTEPDCKATTSPGPDIDVVAVFRGGKLMGVGKPGTCSYSAGVSPACPDNQHNAAADVAAACGPLGDIDGKDISKGYLGLGGGSVELQIGACQSDNETVGSCDGAGAVVEILPGDEIDVYEVDGWYKENGPNGKQTPYYITGACKCISETFEVELRKEIGKSGADDLLVGEKTGTATLTVPTK
jgi:hypothetical protein